MTLAEFLQTTGLDDYRDQWRSRWRYRRGDDLPCFAHRYSVTDAVCTGNLIKEYIKHASNDSDNDVIVFSVTEKDKCWAAWKGFAKAHPRTFKVVEGGSIHGIYLCRMYIYTKPPQKRKFHKDNIYKYNPR